MWATAKNAIWKINSPIAPAQSPADEASRASGISQPPRLKIKSRSHSCEERWHSHPAATYQPITSPIPHKKVEYSEDKKPRNQCYL